MNSYDNLILTKTKAIIVSTYGSTFSDLTVQASEGDITPAKFPYVSMQIIGDKSSSEDLENNENIIELDIEWTTYTTGTTKRNDCKNIMGTIHDKMRSYGSIPRQRPLYVTNADANVCRMVSRYHLVIGANTTIE